MGAAQRKCRAVKPIPSGHPKMDQSFSQQSSRGRTQRQQLTGDSLGDGVLAESVAKEVPELGDVDAPQGFRRSEPDTAADFTLRPGVQDLGDAKPVDRDVMAPRVFLVGVASDR